MATGSAECAEGIPQVIADYINSLPDSPESGTAEWQALRKLDVAAHLSFDVPSTTWEAYREAWGRRYDADLKDNLPVVVAEILDPNLSVTNFPHIVGSGEQGDQSIRYSLQTMVIKGNGAVLALGTELLIANTRREYQELMRPREVSLRELAEIHGKEQELGDIWAAGCKVRDALGAKFGLYAPAIVTCYPTLDDLSKAPTIAEALVQRIRIPGRE